MKVIDASVQEILLKNDRGRLPGQIFLQRLRLKKGRRQSPSATPTLVHTGPGEPMAPTIHLMGVVVPHQVCSGA